MDPRARLLLLLAIAVGAVVGLGAFTFGYARGYSYLTNDPSACANCHVMGEHYAAWMKASHRSVATCNDCHTPHNLVGKYATKAYNGFWHSFYFTTGNYPDPLRANARNHAIAEASCRSCHAEITDAIEHGTRHGVVQAGSPSSEKGKEEFSCIRCHRYVGHWVR
jgi:cytochrome c nitrite reductase small subunit